MRNFNRNRSIGLLISIGLVFLSLYVIWNFAGVEFGVGLRDGVALSASSVAENSGDVSGEKLKSSDAEGDSVSGEMPDNTFHKRFADYLHAGDGADVKITYELALWLDFCKSEFSREIKSAVVETDGISQHSWSCRGVTEDHYKHLERLTSLGLSKRHGPTMAYVSYRLETEVVTSAVEGGVGFNEKRQRYADLIYQLASMGSGEAFGRMARMYSDDLFGYNEPVKSFLYSVIAEADWSKPWGDVLADSKPASRRGSDDVVLDPASVAEAERLYIECCFGRIKLDGFMGMPIKRP